MIYEYSKIVNAEKLSTEIGASAIFSGYQGVSFDGVKTFVHYSVELSESNKLVLDSIINAHSPIDTELEIKFSIAARREFGSKLMENFKLKNLNEGIQWYQAIHLHSRIKDWNVTYPSALGGIPDEQVDIMNMILSGDIETASLALLYGQDDSMTQVNHWITFDRRKWLINQMRAWLGWPLI